MNFFKAIIVRILTLESRLILRKYKPFIVAVTGSVGKTSTKDAIYSVLKSPGLCLPDGGICYVRKTDKSMNSDIGLPLTVIGVPNAWRDIGGWVNNIIAGLKLILIKSEYPDCLILEVGADHPGDIRNIAHWLQPDIAVITKVSKTPVHVEFFDSPEQVFEEKASLAEAVKPGGTLVLFADDEKVASLADRVKDKGVKILTFGITAPATVRGTDCKAIYADNAPIGISFTLDLVGEKSPVIIHNILGSSYMYPLLAAAAVGKARNVPLASIVSSLESYDAPKGRMHIIQGLNGSTLIDDTYNSSPDAVVSALDTLKGLETSGAKIAVLGDMMELGKYSTEQHRGAGKEVVGSANQLITVGPRSRATAEEAVKGGLPAGAANSFATSEEAAAFLAPIVKSGDIILIKGSQSMRMEKVAKALLRQPERAGELLVRQEKEWLRKE